MKIFVTAHYQMDENKTHIESLCAAVKQSGMEDFCFIRDIENYQPKFDNPKELWDRAFTEISKCDALLVDATDNPTGGRFVESGIAFAIKKPIFVIAKRGEKYKQLFDGLAAQVIEYTDYKDIIEPLRDFAERNLL